MISGISSSSIASQLFSKLDTSSKGYLEKSDLASAFSKISSDGDSSGIDEMFSALDSDSDGKVTESEFSTTLAKLEEQLQSNYQQSQGMGGPGGPGGGMPPPPPQDDEGFTQEELQSQLDALSSSEDSDSERTSLISDIVNNFEAADTDGDGKVSFQEAMAYRENSSESSTSDATSTTGTQAANGMPPPPPPPNDQGFSLEELQSQLEDIGSSDSQRASLLSNIVDNFSSADTDGDGKVTFQEAMSYDQNSSTGSSSSTSTTTASTDSTSSTDAASEKRLLQQIMQLMQAYGRPDDSSSSLLSTLSTSA